MARITIDLAEAKDKEGLHFLLKEKLGFPDYYGNNLDALWDLLNEITEETELCFASFGVLEESMPQYADKFRITLEQAAEENPCLCLAFI